MPARPTQPVLIRSTAEFARYVGLSRSTVSRALNGHGDLRPKSMERIQAAIQATGFTPNAHALHLRGRRSAMVGVCMENFLTPTAVAKVSALQQGLRDAGLVALIEVLEPGASQKTLEHFRSLRVEAVVFIGHFETAELAARITELDRHGTPHLVIDSVGVRRANTVSLDRTQAMADVVTRLHALGHRRFGLLGLSGNFQTVADRLTGIHRAVTELGLDPAASLLAYDHLHARRDHFEYGAVLAQEFLQHAPRPTAFIAVNDETAVGALLHFQAAGLSVPRDFSMVGFNNQNICLMTRPALSSVDQQIAETARIAVEILTRQIARPFTTRPLHRLVRPKFVDRGSIGPAGA
ncbi:LacI family DNA-binding transcriptional regulator [Opitutus sp. ER46]|uniref:LacI family DNA-binding transcriptional regulator n=1 Tax=Opitutus sp. ER46 TaxID=2161864 RepID=UPI0011B28C7F|nr:LacI family DNA-binding transcriptional regulator [Opitutus sp. ER46]